MCRINGLFVVVGLVSAIVLLVAIPVTRADVVTVANPSFESPVGNVNSYASGPLDSWNSAGAAHTEIDNGTFNLVSSGGLAPDGDQTAWCRQEPFWQNTGTALVSGWIYTLSFYDGNGEAYVMNHTATLNAADNTTDLGTAFGTWFWDAVATGDGFHAHSFSATYTGDSGKYLGVSLGATNPSLWAGFDMVSITSVPEPSVMALMTTGLIGLLCYAWRKRK